LRRRAIAVVVSLGALVFAGSAQACSCARPAPAQAMRQADAAIAGELLEVVPRGRVSADYRYRVQRVYKRWAGLRRGSVISVRSARQAAACGLPRRTGRRYGLLLTRGRGHWIGGVCGMFRPRPLGPPRALRRCAG
jgi:hypothetical protein